MVVSTEQPRGLGVLGGRAATAGLAGSALVVGLGVAGATYGSPPLAAIALTVTSAYLVLSALGRSGAGATAGLLLSAVVVGAAVAGGGYGVPAVVVVGVPLGVAALVLAVLRPPLAVAGSLLVIVGEAVDVPLGALGALSATETACLLVAFGWCWRAATGDPTVRYPQIADYPLLVLVLAVVPGVVLGVEPTLVLRLAVLYGAFFLVFLTVKGFSPQELRVVLTAFVVGAGVLSAFGVLAYVTGGGVSVAGTNVSGRAAYGIPDPNYFGAYLLVAAAPALALLVDRTARLAPVTVGSLALCVGALVLTFSRGALLGALVAFAVVLVSWSRSRALSAVTVVVVVLTALANLNPLLEGATTEVVARRITSIGQPSSGDSRLELWRRSVQRVQDDPVGTGALQFDELSTAAGITERGAPLENAHNAYLNIAVELGLLGLAAYLLWHARVLWDVVVEVRRRRPQTRALAIGVGAAFAGFSVQAMTIVQYRVQSILAVMFVLTGVSAAARAWPGPEEEPTGPQEQEEPAQRRTPLPTV